MPGVPPPLDSNAVADVAETKRSHARRARHESEKGTARLSIMRPLRYHRRARSAHPHRYPGKGVNLPSDSMRIPYGPTSRPWTGSEPRHIDAATGIETGHSWTPDNCDRTRYGVHDAVHVAARFRTR